MLTSSQRTAILELHAKKLGSRAIARALRISRAAVKTVIRSGSAQPSPIERERKAEAHREEILRFYDECGGNLVRVREELGNRGIEIAYTTLTSFCREAGISRKPRLPSGQYHFEPGQEIQHDTSPHQATIGGKQRKIQTAAAVLCHSRMRFVQCYPRFRRFECKIFLTEAIRFFGGAAQVVMIDNTHVVVLHGSGETMVPVPEMEAFGQRLGFTFRAHAIGHADRSARVERGFWHFETNFLAGRTFSDWNDLNQQALAWCERQNATFRRHLQARPIDLFAQERLHLQPLPIFIPEPHRLHHRIVDVEGYVTLETHKYSVPVDWIGRQVQVRETAQKVEIRLRASRPAVIHQRVIDPRHGKTTLPEHQLKRGQGRKRRGPCRDETILRKIAPELGPYIDQLKTRRKKSIVLALRQLRRMTQDYPREPLRAAVERAERYGLYDLDRLERLVLDLVTGDYFQLDPQGEKND